MQMQCKIVKSMPNGVEDAINEWLVDNPRVEICHISATSLAGSYADIVTIILYRSDEEQAEVPPWNVGLRESKV